MNDKAFCIVLTNGTEEMEYYVRAFNDEQAIILAQAEAIQCGNGYKFVRFI
jgi:hypothetical protein